MHILPRRSALAAALISALLTPSLRAEITASGAINIWPTPLPLGPGDTDLGTNGLGVGYGAPGSFAVTAGSQFSAAFIGFGGNGNGSGIGLFDGANTRVSLTSDGNGNRFDVGNWGTGELTVSGGATLDGRANAAACLLGAQWCHNFIGNAAGSDATFTVTGAGSNASFLRAFVVGGLAVFRPPIETFTLGTPGATTQGRVNVLAGGSLTTDGAQVGAAPGGSSPVGNERSFAEVVIDGTGSVWRLSGDSFNGGGVNFSTATHRNAWATVAISSGGKLRVEGPAGRYNAVNLTGNGGRTDMTISGADSMIEYVGDAGVLQVGQRLGSASLVVSGGGQVRGVWYTAVGRDGAFGEMTLDGAGSQLLAGGTASAAANGSPSNATVDIGRKGTGVVHVLNGARIEINASEARNNGPQLNLGREAASSGTLNISGAGSVVALSAASVLPGGGPGEAINPLVKIGRDGSGTLNISNGGQLLLNGQATSTLANSRSTALFIGGTSDTLPGGKGQALVSGAGSAIAVSGSDPYIGVGVGAQSSGQLTIQNQGSVSSSSMSVGRSGGIGVLKLDGGVLNLSGQHTGNNGSGANLSIGLGGGTGVATVDHGSVITLTNMGSAGTSLNLGGTTIYPGGDGSLTLTGGSQIKLIAAPNRAAVTVGRDGSAFMRVRGGSTLDVGDGAIFVGRLPGSDGTLIVSEGSTVTAGWVGVGRNKAAGQPDVDGGTATMVLNNSTLTAPNIVIGTNGFLGGNGTIVGNVVNHGIFSPGNSPGTMFIQGAYTAASGSRLIMEVQDDGAGGFNTDRVIFGEGSALDLAALKVEFRFLGATDPNAFQASGSFDIDTFFQARSAAGVDSALAHALFSTASFSAQADRYTISNFSFSSDGGAVFSAAAVPEPQSGLLLLAGLALVAGARRQRALALRRVGPGGFAGGPAEQMPLR